jgi:hypothetical protein
MRRWADDRLVAKVLIANQTRIIEAVADSAGQWLPAVPVVAAYPLGGQPGQRCEEIAAVLTSPVASVWMWHRSAGTGLSACTVRIGPSSIGDVPWPAGDLGAAVAALRCGDVHGCGAATMAAYRVDDGELWAWWSGALDRIERRAEQLSGR